MGNADADLKVSVVILKDGEHKDFGPHDGYTEWTYKPSEVHPAVAANAVVKGVEQLIKNGKYIDVTGKAHPKDYPFVDSDGNVHFSTRGDELRVVRDTPEVIGDDMREAAGERRDKMREAGRRLNDELAGASDDLFERMRIVNTAMRSAGSAQRGYDKETVKALADYAQAMIDGGLLSGMTDYEAKRVIAAVKNGTATENVVPQLEKLFDIGLRHQENESKAEFEQSLKTGGRKHSM